MIEFVLHPDPPARLEPEIAAELAATMEASAVERQVVRSLLTTVQWPSRTCPPSVFSWCSSSDALTDALADGVPLQRCRQDLEKQGSNFLLPCGNKGCTSGLLICRRSSMKRGTSSIHGMGACHLSSICALHAFGWSGHLASAPLDSTRTTRQAPCPSSHHLTPHGTEESGDDSDSETSGEVLLQSVLQGIV